jgi:hypothetical protein
MSFLLFVLVALWQVTNTVAAASCKHVARAVLRAGRVGRQPWALRFGVPHSLTLQCMKCFVHCNTSSAQEVKM